ncbi:MAG TPA: nuclear transport factor 2 family protein [Solimonas sp.]|nr:nuclear transport factor 2 family protein [Solimonas sp.]
MARFDRESALIAIELQQLVAEFAHEIDSNDGLDLARFYTADGVFFVGDTQYQGHAAINKFYSDRLERIPALHKDGIRVGAHTFLNLRTEVRDPHNASVFFTNVSYAGEGKPPVRATITPAMITTCRMDFRLEADGQWRIASFTGTPVFVGDDPFTRAQLLKN